MPTAARLTASVCLAVLAYVLSELVKPLMPESTAFGMFVPLNIVLGLVVGWVVMGPRVGRGRTWAINNGLTGAVALMFWGIFIQACNEMVRLAMRGRYDGPLEAIVAVFTIAAEYAVIAATLPIAGVMVVGGILAGLLTEFAGRRWR